MSQANAKVIWSIPKGPHLLEFLHPLVEMARDHTSQASSPSLFIAQSLNDPTLMISSSPFVSVCFFSSSLEKKFSSKKESVCTNVKCLLITEILEN